MSKTVELGEKEFKALSGLLRDRFGLDYPPQKKAELEKAYGRLSGGRSPAEFCRYVASPLGGDLLQRLINHLTVGETYFFRIQAHFDALRDVILPTIIKRRAGERRLRIWSAGCATGEEPYSVAMLILETLPDWKDWRIEFLATDINTDFLVAARGGRYREWSFRKVDDYWRRKYFAPADGEWQVSGDVRTLVRFARANLLDEQDNVATAPASFDLILCRNVFIYFDGESIARASALFCRYLAPGGWYVGGHAEPFVFDDGFEVVNFPGAFVHRKLTLEEAAYAKKRRRPPEPPRKPIPRALREAELDQADRLVAAGDDTRALERLAKLAAAREDAELCWRMGRVLGNLGRYDEGLEWCRRGVALDKTNPYCYYISALIQEEMGANEEAFENLRRSLYVEKNFVLGHFSMASYHRWRRDEERAARSYRNVLKLLEGRADDEEISGDGLTVGRLREIVKQIL